MKFPQKLPQIDTRTFYFIGKWCFFIMAILNLAGWINSLAILDGLSILRGLASVVFSFALFGFFSWMFNSTPKKENLNDDEMKALSKVIDTADLKDFTKKATKK